MKRYLSIIAILVMVMFMAGCVTTRVISRTDSTAVIQGLGHTRVEALATAREKGKEIFTSFNETKEAECSQEYNFRADTESAHGSTFWSCIIHIEKE
jgi:hypothetical protein